MKISFNWLKEYVEVNCSVAELAERLSIVGLAVETIHPQGDDFLLEFDLTSNRPDALSHFGIAREAAVICGTKASLLSGDLKESNSSVAEATSVEILNPELCARYVARVIRGVKVGPSPEWLVKRLESVGQRSINNIADITNFVLLEQGHPLHAFDYQRLAGHRIVVRTAQPGETLRTLDGVERKLRPDMLVIADAEQPVAMAGIMGGEASEISKDTTDVLLESAYFAPLSVRRTARALDLATEASHRFERGADREACVRSINRCAQLICEIAGGELLKGVVDVYPQPLAVAPIDFHYNRITALTGLTVAPERIEQILTGLGCQLTTVFAGFQSLVTPPSHRIDIKIAEDLVEEVARHIGYDQIALTLPQSSGAGVYLPGEDRRRLMRDALISLGYAETISFSWVAPALDRRFQTEELATITIENPIDEERPQMRTSLLPGMLEALQRNFSFGLRNVSLFEIGKCFQAGEPRPNEYERLAFIATGQRNEDDWQAQQEMIDFYDIKGAVEMLLACCGSRDYQLTSANVPYLHPGQAAQISINNQLVARFGQLAPALRDEFKVKQGIFIAEIFLDKLLNLPSLGVKYRPLPKLQSVSRDISLLVADSVSFEMLKTAIESLEIKELLQIKLFDIYTGKNLPEGYRSLSLKLRYQPGGDISMTDEQINALDQRIIEKLATECNAQLRR